MIIICLWFTFRMQRISMMKPGVDHFVTGDTSSPKLFVTGDTSSPASVMASLRHRRHFVTGDTSSPVTFTATLRHRRHFVTGDTSSPMTFTATLRHRRHFVTGDTSSPASVTAAGVHAMQTLCTPRHLALDTDRQLAHHDTPNTDTCHTCPTGQHSH